jgi:hypothetical protein
MPAPAGGERGPAGRALTGHPEGVVHPHLAHGPPLGQGGVEHVGLDRGGDHRAVPLQHGRDDHPDGLVAAGRAIDQHRMAILSRQQLPRQAAGAAKDQPTGLGVADQQPPQLRAPGPGRGPLPRRATGPTQPWPVASTDQAQHLSGGRARRGGRRGEGGVHADRAGQGRLRVGRPGELRVAQVLAQVNHHTGQLGRVDVQPGVTERQPGDLTGDPYQPAGDPGRCYSVSKELIARGERRWLRPVVPGGKAPRLTTHVSHLRRRPETAHRTSERGPCMRSATASQLGVREAGPFARQR